MFNNTQQIIELILQQRFHLLMIIFVFRVCLQCNTNLYKMPLQIFKLDNKINIKFSYNVINFPLISYNNLIVIPIKYKYHIYICICVRMYAH